VARGFNLASGVSTDNVDSKGIKAMKEGDVVVFLGHIRKNTTLESRFGTLLDTHKNVYTLLMANGVIIRAQSYEVVPVDQVDYELTEDL
jgi:hypothetical protein